MFKKKEGKKRNLLEGMKPTKKKKMKIKKGERREKRKKSEKWRM